MGGPRQALVAALALAAAPAIAQEAAPVVPVVTLDQDRLFVESLYGRRVAEEIEAESAALAAENRQIEAELTAEERALTERRPSLPPEEFRALADAFDEKVESLRQQQDAKARELQRRSDVERRNFLARALPVLSRLVAERGALVILDDRAVLLAAESIDITDAAIARVDSVLGDGNAPPLREEAPEHATDPSLAPEAEPPAAEE